MQTRLSDVILDTETDYLTWIRFTLNERIMKARDITMDDILEILSSSKKFTIETSSMQLLMRLTEESDASTVITLRDKLKKTLITGVANVGRVSLVQKGNKWMIQTIGSNLSKILTVAGVANTRVKTNNVFEIAETLGIEAARNSLIYEIHNTLEDQGLEVDVRYIMLVADLMCAQGHMQQIGRHGVAGTKDSVLARAAFEITVPTIAHAALAGEVENLRGVTENVIVGSDIPIGSGTVDLYMHVNKKRNTDK